MTRTIILVVLILIANNTFSQKKLWGLSKNNGVINGTIFTTDSAGNNYSDIYTFNNVTNGVNPYGSLVQAFDGNLYGMTHEGGINNFGVIFKINPTTLIYTKVHDFDSVNGCKPYGSLVQTNNGKLYGLTHNGGNHPAVKNLGVLFSFDIASNTYANEVNFNGQNGAHPYGSLILGKDSFLYAMCSIGGVDGTGNMFAYNYYTGNFTALYSFILGPSQAGYDPHGSLLLLDNKLFGFSRYGDVGFTNGGGVLFEYNLALPYWNAFTSRHHFDSITNFQNGYELMGSLINGNDNFLYGMTVFGGADSAGTIFKYNLLDSSITSLYSFNKITDGYHPHGSLLKASNGNLYGLTSSELGQGKLFEFNLNNNTISIKTNVTGTPYYSTLIEVDEFNVGFENSKIQPCKVYPNPTSNFLFIENINIAESLNYRLINMQGQILFQGNVFSKQNLDISKLNCGIYSVVFNSKNGSFVYKLIKK